MFADFNQYDFHQIDQGKFYALDITAQDIFVFDDFIPESPERYKGLVLQSGANFNTLSQQYQLQAPPIHHPILEEVTWELFDENIFAAPETEEEPNFSSSRQKVFYNLARLPASNEQQWLVLNRDIFQQPEAEAYHQEKEQVAYKLLFNALDYLSFSPQEINRGNTFKCGEIVHFPPEFQNDGEVPLTITLPSGDQKGISGDQRFFLGEKTGIYQIEGGEQKWQFSLNLLDDRISTLEGQMINALPSATLAELDVETNRSTEQKRPRAGLLLIILVLIGIDWFYFYYRIRSEAE